MNELESIAVIKEMIERSRSNFKEQSFYYLLWGWLVLGSVATEAILISQGVAYHWIVWGIMGVVGGVTSSIYGSKQVKKAGRTTQIDHFMKYVWIGFIMYLFVVILNTPRFGWDTAYILIAGLYGFGTFISGGLLRFKPLIYGGIASFVLVFVIGIFPQLISNFNDGLVLLGISIIVSYLIPGYMLKRS